MSTEAPTKVTWGHTTYTSYTVPGYEKSNTTIHFEDCDDSSKPLAIIFGYFKATRKPLEKYADVYHAHGYRTMICIAESKYNVWFIPSNEEYLRPLAAKVVDIIIESGISSVPKIISPMSNGGAWQLAEFARLVSGADDSVPKPNEQVQAIYNSITHIIYDSCPLFFYKRKDGLALYHGFNPSRNRLADIPLTFVIARFVQQTFTKKGHERVSLCKKLITSFNPNVKHMFLYSDGDKAVPARPVRDYMAEVVKLGYIKEDKIDSFNFGPDSRHVLHLKDNPEEYKKVIASTLSDVAPIPKPAPESYGSPLNSPNEFRVETKTQSNLDDQTMTSTNPTISASG